MANFGKGKFGSGMEINAQVVNGRSVLSVIPMAYLSLFIEQSSDV